MSDTEDPGTIIEVRAGTTARWAERNPILAEDETGWETDGTRGVKIGDGVTAWNDLPYSAGEAVDPTVGVFRSTDGSFGLSAPTGVGGELVITADVLEDIRYDGNSL